MCEAETVVDQSSAIPFLQSRKIQWRGFIPLKSIFVAELEM